MSQSQIDTLVSFVKAKLKAIDAPKISGQMPLDINRAEFFELLVRVALFKYKENAPKGSIMTVIESVEQLVIKNIRPNFEPAPW